MSRKHNFKAVSVLPYLVLVWLAAVCLGYFSLLNAQPDKDPDRVFCPLQKSWVKKSPSSETRVKPEPLEEICASDSQKESFIYESFQKLKLTPISLDAKQTEALFFDYAEKGSAVFAAFSNSRSAPQTELVKAVNVEKGTLALQKEFLKTEAKALLEIQQPRPPGVEQTASFVSQKFVSLKNISRKISPRAPPPSFV